MDSANAWRTLRSLVGPFSQLNGNIWVELATASPITTLRKVASNGRLSGRKNVMSISPVRSAAMRVESSGMMRSSTLSR